jgi:hypothetical protein
VRYHGDCQKHIKETQKKGAFADHNIFPAYYYCLDILKNAQFTEAKIIPAKNYSSCCWFIQPVLEIRVPDFSFIDWNIPEIRCRSATLILSSPLRAPPIHLS